MRTREADRRRTVLRWVVQGQLALVLLGVGGTKGFAPVTAGRSDVVPRAIGLVEVVAGLAVAVGARRQPF